MALLALNRFAAAQDDPVDLLTAKDHFLFSTHEVKVPESDVLAVNAPLARPQLEGASLFLSRWANFSHIPDWNPIFTGSFKNQKTVNAVRFIRERQEENALIGVPLPRNDHSMMVALGQGFDSLEFLLFTETSAAKSLLDLSLVGRGQALIKPGNILKVLAGGCGVSFEHIVPDILVKEFLWRAGFRWALGRNPLELSAYYQGHDQSQSNAFHILEEITLAAQDAGKSFPRNLELNLELNLGLG